MIHHLSTRAAAVDGIKSTSCDEIFFCLGRGLSHAVYRNLYLTLFSSDLSPNWDCSLNGFIKQNCREFRSCFFLVRPWSVLYPPRSLICFGHLVALFALFSFSKTVLFVFWSDLEVLK